MSIINTLGPVGLNPTGEYNNTKKYERLDVVLYEGSSYVALKDSIGQLPTNTEYWDKLVSGGVGVDDIVDNLNSNDSDKVLSANQGNILNNKIDNEITISQPYLNEELGTCVLIKNKDLTILSDCGNTGQDTLIRNFLDTKEVENIDVLIITHFHGDHAGCQETILREYCNENTKIYIGMVPDYSQFGISESGSYTRYQRFLTLCSELGLSYEVPTNNSSEVINNVKLRFLNTDTSYLEDYYDSYSDSNIDNYKKSNLNNLSLVCEITINGEKILITGDVEQTAQTKIASYINKVNIMQIPHHNYNSYGDKTFFDNANPDITFANRGTSAVDLFPYFSRYVRFVKPIRIIQNYQVPIELSIKNGHIDILSGVDFITAFNDNSKNQILTFLPESGHCTFDEVDLYDFSVWDSDYINDLFYNCSERKEISTPFYRTSRYTSLVTELNNIDDNVAHLQYKLEINNKYMEFINSSEAFTSYRIYFAPDLPAQKYVALMPFGVSNIELTGSDINIDNVRYRQSFVAFVSDDATTNVYNLTLNRVNSSNGSATYIGYWQNLSQDRYLTFMKAEIIFTSNGYTFTYYRVVYDKTANAWTINNSNPELVKITV